MELMGCPNMPPVIMNVLMQNEPLHFEELKAAMEAGWGEIVVEQLLVEALHDMRKRGVITHGSGFTNIRRALG